MSIATTVLWVGTFLISFFTPIMLTAGNIGKTAAEAGGYTFIIFGVNAVILWVFTRFFIPETKQKTLEEIELSLEEISAVVHYNSVVMKSRLLLFVTIIVPALALGQAKNYKLLADAFLANMHWLVPPILRRADGCTSF